MYDFSYFFFFLSYIRYCKFNLFFIGTFIGAFIANGELCIEMQFSDREVVIRAIKS